MAPNITENDDSTPINSIQTETICEKDENVQIGTDFTFKRKIIWKNAIGFLILHLCGFYGVYLTLTGQSKFITCAWGIGIGWLSGEGVTMGAHRLWTHRSFRATFTLRLILMILFTMAGQNCMWVWVRDHRQHHRYSDTDGDPHNARRGFFFSHMGWLMSKKHPLSIKLGKTIYMEDLKTDKLVMFQKNHYKKLYFIFALLLPIWIPVHFWNEQWINSIIVAFFLRYIVVLNATWCVNSLAHIYGYKPYDKNILPVQSMFVSFFSTGEGWHNYHHVFPWDYKTAETGTPIQGTTYIIKACEYLGLAYDLKEVSPETIKSRSKRTGDYIMQKSEKIRQI